MSNLWGTAKTVLRGKLIELSIFKKRKISSQSSKFSPQNNLEIEQSKPKASRGK